ncbi:MAG TPA: class I lanthipeptide [Haliangiales bacterium]|nr:class I lanthipeptide [Haliangiales bacterium]
MKRDAKKLVLKKQTLRTLTTTQLDGARGGGSQPDSHNACVQGGAAAGVLTL